jgi:acyl carrier protein
MVHAQWEAVVSSKVLGSKNFHEALNGMEIDFFIALSSVAGIIGNRGQAAYAAANCFLDALMENRRQHGLPGISIALTAVSDIGYLSENSSRSQEVNKTLGVKTMGEQEILALLGAAIDGSMTESCGSTCITGLATPPKTNEPYWMVDPKFASLRRSDSEEDTSNGATASKSLQARLKAISNIEEATNLVCGGLVTKIASVLMLPETDIETKQAPVNYGLDSLAAIEIRNWITRELEANLAVLELLTSESFFALSSLILEKSRVWTQPANGTA